MARVRLRAARVLGITVWPRGLRVPGLCSRPFLVAGRTLSAGAVLAGLLLLGAWVPASAQTMTWSVVPSPNAGVASNLLEGVSCASATSCMAVGYFIDSSAIARTLTESWDGTSWTGVPSRNPGLASNNNYFQGVSCASATACMAVGDSDVSGSPVKTLTESWDGTSWTVLHSPSPVVGGNLFNSVSCTSATACMAVGVSHFSIGPWKTLTESWDGTSWTVLPSRNPFTGGNTLTGVSCTSATACMAVGFGYTSGGEPRTLIESWDGTSWTVLPSPNPNVGVNDDFLYGVSCTSATACIAVGTTTTSGGEAPTLSESWNGTSWTVVPSPGSEGGVLYGVSCASATACTAAGTAGLGRTLIQSWDGTSWTIVPSPNRSLNPNVLYSISCISATACTAVGDSRNTNRVDRTLIESSTASS